MGSGQCGDRGIDIGDARQIEDNRVFAFFEFAQLAPADEHKQRHADVGDQADDQQPGEGVAGRAFFTDQPRDGENGQQEPTHG